MRRGFLPTNLGLLLNARQVACRFGYLTVPEFSQLTMQTLATVADMEKHRGHLLNWYDTQSLQPLAPQVVSSVDSGNFLASLWTLEQGSLDLLDRPLFPSTLAGGLLDHISLLCSLDAIPRRQCAAIEEALRGSGWLQYILDIPDAALKDIHQPGAAGSANAEIDWLQQQAEERIRQVGKTAQLCAPWLLPEYSTLRPDRTAQTVDAEGPALKQLPEHIDALTARLQKDLASPGSPERTALTRELLDLTNQARSRVLRLIDDLNNIASRSCALAASMDFAFLLNRGRSLLSVAFEVEKQRNNAACYDLLASEARIAYFVAIAKDDIPQEGWFQLGRPPLPGDGIGGLLSWTGTMFEYLMPALWMRLYPNTLLERAAEAAVQCQRAYAARQGIPCWGISESGFNEIDASGNYGYFAFGVPQLAIHKPDKGGPVISPYSTFLALDVDSAAALRNLRSMQRKEWLGTYGFYEAADFSPDRRQSPLVSRKSQGFELVRCWMAHHQGMTLLAIANFLDDKVVQDWFHSHPRVQATELLLQEKPAGRTTPFEAAG